MSYPLISVILPFYNAELYLKESIESVLEQVNCSIELILVDDSSNDSSLLIASAYTDNPNVILIRNTSQSGISFCLDKAISVASGQFIARMDADDICLPTRISRQISFMIENSLDVCGSSAFKIDENGNIIGKIFSATSHNEINLTFITTSPFIHPTVIFRSEFLNANKFLYTDSVSSGFAEDYDLFVRMALSKARFGNLPEFVFKYRIVKSSLSRTNFIQIKKDRKLLSDLYISHMISSIRDSFSDLSLNNERIELRHLRALWVLLFRGYFWFIYFIRVILRSDPLIIFKSIFHHVRGRI